MFKLPRWMKRAVFTGVAAFAVLFAIIYAGGWKATGLQAAATAPSLGSAGSYAVLAAAGVTNTGSTVVTGDLGTHPTAAVTGFFGTTANDGPGIVNGAIHQADAAALAARNALTTAYNNAAGQAPDSTVVTELGGQTLTPGVYTSASGTFGITGTLTLNGDASAVWVFKTASTLITAGSSTVSLIGGAQACNVFWQVGSSATLGASSTFRGTILANTTISVGNSATVDGRLLAGAVADSGAVTLNANTITRATCAAPTATATAIAATPTATPPAVTPTPTVTPLPATATAIAATATAIAATPTATPPAATPTPTVTPLPATATAIAATATAIAATPTETPLPATATAIAATATAIPATPTETPSAAIPTETSLPATATAIAATPTATPPTPTQLPGTGGPDVGAAGRIMLGLGMLALAIGIGMGLRLALSHQSRRD